MVETGAHFNGNCRYRENPLDCDAVRGGTIERARNSADRLDREKPLPAATVTQLLPDSSGVGVREMIAPLF